MARHRKWERLPRGRRRLGLLALSLLSLSVTLVEVLRLTRHRPESRVYVGAMQGPSIDEPQFPRVLELLTGTHLDPGNRVEMLLNGDATFPRLWRDLASARRTITMQMYYARPGRVSDTLASILCERVRGGVRVLLVLDAFGSVMPRAWLDGLRACGVEVAVLRQLKWYTLHSATERSHVRAVVVDGRIGYTGGFGLADYWLGDGRHRDQWRESNVRFEGPAVAGLQAAFTSAWAEVTGELLGGSGFYPDDIARDSLGVDAGLLFTAPTIGNTAAERFLALAIRSARSRLFITNSYFVPNLAFRRMLADAGDRGVDVRVLTVSANTDVKTPWLAGRSFYEELHAHGVRIYEYQPAMMHAKTIVVDGVWTTIGSMNFDNRSLAFNDEANLVVLDRALGAQMEAEFLEDLRFSTEMTAPILAERPWWQRLLERGAVLLSHVL